MTKNRVSALKNAFFMLAPVALLGGVGFLLQNRKPAILTVTGPFEMFVKSVKFVPVKPKEVQDGYDTKVEVEFGSRGRIPSWWEKGFDSYSGEDKGQVVALRDGSARIVGTPFTWEPHLDKSQPSSPRWIATYLLTLSPVPASSGEVHLRQRIQIEHRRMKYGNPLWLDWVVRRNGQKTQVPAVSRNPQLIVERWTLDKAPPVENNVNTGSDSWRLILQFHKQRAPKDSDRDGIGDSLQFRDAKGAEFSLDGSTQWSNADEERTNYDAYRRKLAANSRISYITHDFTEESLTSNPSGRGATSKINSPIWIQGEATWNDYWPLWVKIPFRNAQGQVMLTPRPTPAFKIISVSLRKASAAETTEDGSDTVVVVVVGALNPTVNVAKWEWQGSFSEHLQDAKGRNHWLFPYKGLPKQTILMNYQDGPSPDKMRFEYRFALASIPKNAGQLTFHAEVSANGSRRIPVSLVVRPSESNVNRAKPNSTPSLLVTPTP